MISPSVTFRNRFLHGTFTYRFNLWIENRIIQKFPIETKFMQILMCEEQGNSFSPSISLRNFLLHVPFILYKSLYCFLSIETKTPEKFHVPTSEVTWNLVKKKKKLVNKVQYKTNKCPVTFAGECIYFYVEPAYIFWFYKLFVIFKFWTPSLVYRHSPQIIEMYLLQVNVLFTENLYNYAFPNI